MFLFFELDTGFRRLPALQMYAPEPEKTTPCVIFSLFSECRASQMDMRKRLREQLPAVFCRFFSKKEVKNFLPRKISIFVSVRCKNPFT